MNNRCKNLPSLVIVGNGMVTGRLLDELLARQGKRFAITVIGDEKHGSYNRIMLSSVLAKDATTASIVQKDHLWYEANGIQFIAGARVNHIDRDARSVSTQCGKTVNYDHLVIATGSRAASIPAGNTNLANIFPFRTIADTQAMMKVAESAKTAAVVGGGLLGLEAAYGLAKAGIKVTLIHRSKWLLNRQLDQSSAAMLQAVMADMGICFQLGDEIDTFIGTESVTGAKLKSGEHLDCDMAVIATGITPNAELGQACGLNGKRAIAVDDFMATDDAHISAVGECIEHNGLTFGLVDPLWRQAETLAARLVNNHYSAFQNTACATKLKVSGVNVFSAGEVEQREGLRQVIVQDKANNVYRKLLLENDRIVGIVLFGDVSSGAFYFEQMQQAENVAAHLPNLIFGEAFMSSTEQQTQAA